MTAIAVGTEKGGYLVEGEIGVWSVTGPIFPGWRVTAFGNAPDGTHLVAVGSSWFGVGIQRSTDFENWLHVDAPPTWPEDAARKMNEVWTFHTDSNRIWAGVSEAGLFTSDDEGFTWSPVKGLNEHPTRENWQPGLGGLCAHRLLSDGDTKWVAISAVGVLRSDDGGVAWELKNDGIDPTGLPEDAPRPEVGYCVHCIATDPARPGWIWRQDHSGVYRTEDGGDSWHRIEKGLPANFGFVLWRDDGSGRLFTVPLEADTNRLPLGGELRVYASDDDGDSWAVAGAGWNDSPQFTGVLRGAFDGNHRGRFCFGTTGGKLWLTDDGGEHWHELPPSFPRIGAVRLIT